MQIMRDSIDQTHQEKRGHTLLQTRSAAGRPFGIFMICGMASFAALISIPSLAGEPSPFEVVGEAAVVPGLPINLVTKNSSGYEAWGKVEGGDQIELVGIKTQTGEVERVDLTQFGVNVRVQITKGADGNIYIFAGRPGRFLKFDVESRKLTDLGVPAPEAYYWLGQTVAPDGKFYIGTMPNAVLVSLDPATGKVANHGSLADDVKQKYLVHPLASNDNMIYCPVGLHHPALVAFDPKTGKSKQILPPELMKGSEYPRLTRGTDGQVYGALNGQNFLCKPDGIEPGKTCPPEAREKLLAGDKQVNLVDEKSQLILLGPGVMDKSTVQTKYQGKAIPVFSLAFFKDGRLHGGCISPALVFAYDEAKMEFQNFGSLTTGKVQVYNLLENPKGAGVFLGSYTLCAIDFWDPDAPIGPDNPKPVASLADDQNQQERPTAMIAGPDKNVYVGTAPLKGLLGGALVKVDPATFAVKVWRNVVPNQSVASLVAVPETGDILAGSCILGGSSSIPTEKEAVLFAWDPAKEKGKYTTKPVPGAQTYDSLVRTPGGIVYGTADKTVGPVGASGKGPEGENESFFAFDPVKQKTLFTGTLPVSEVRHPGLFPRCMGPGNLIYGIGDDALFAIDPSDNSARIIARDASFKTGLGLFITDTGHVYYGSGYKLMRYKLDWSAPSKPLADKSAVEVPANPR